MSDDSDSSDSGSSPPPETLVAGRAKRATAGNRLSHLLQHLEDEDIKADLLADQEDDQRDYSASEDGDGDVAFDSSDDSEDEAKEGDDQDLAGEKELRKQERVESRKKRKARELVRIQPLKKKVKISEIAPAEPSPSQTTPVTKPERLTLADFGPTRHSSRTQTVANAKVTAARMKESKRRAARTQEVMRIAAEKKAAEAGPKLTQADRMARALKIEKINSRSLNRWEKSEQERLRIQQEKLEAMRNRKLDGPIYRYWSGPVTWLWREGPEGPVYQRCKYDTVIKSKIEDVDQKNEHHKGTQDQRQSLQKSGEGQTTQASTEDTATDPSQQPVPLPEMQQAKATQQALSEVPEPQKDSEQVASPQADAMDVDKENPGETNNAPVAEAVVSRPKDTGADATSVEETAAADPPTEENSFLDGIHDYASLPVRTTEATEQHDPVPAEGDSLMGPYTTEPTPDPGALPYFPSMPPYIHNPWPQRPQLPLLTERAARTLLVLDSFGELGPAPAVLSRRAAPDPMLTRLLLPGTHPALSAEERRYLSARARRGAVSNLPPPPARATCAVSGRPARFRDPKTGLPYADLTASKAIQRTMANGCQWSALLGVWAGIVGEGTLGRVARGVPEGFWTGKVKETEKEQAEVKEV